ncbi:SPY, partial [Symbiodinium sp. CCMP2456]
MAVSIPDGSGARDGMFSARFDGGDTEMLFRQVYKILKDRGYPVMMVEEGAGGDFGTKTATFLGRLRKHKGVMLSVCTSHYGEMTSSTYSSYKEVKFAQDHDLEILPLRMCGDPWPPEPPSGPGHKYDKDGTAEGLIAMAIPPSKIYVECRGRDAEWIAARIAEKLRQKGASPDISPSSAGYSGHQAVVPSASPSAAEAKAWFDLGSKGGGERNGQKHSEKACYLKALEAKENHADAWYNLGVVGGGTVKGQAYDQKACYEKALEAKENDASAWYNLGLEGGGTVKGQAYDEK